jgi:hypothetical protein
MFALRLGSPLAYRGMDLTLLEQSKARCEIGAVRRRHVIYIAGYEPRGARGYYKLFERECDRFRRVWPVALTLKASDFDSGDFTRWLVNARTSDWQVSATYDFLRLEKFIKSDLAEPVVRHILRSLGWIVDDLVSGAQLRIFRASWRFGLHLLFHQFVLLAWLAISSAFGGIAGYLVIHALGSPTPAGIAAALLATLASFRALQPLAIRWGAIQIPSCWVVLRRFARGQATWLDPIVDIGARRLVAAAKANDADELVVVGHSAGCVIASAVIARALELDPELGRRGRRLVLLTLGSVIPAAALHPAAQRMRDIVRRLAAEPRLSWIDCQFRRDVMTFMKFDLVDGVGARVGAQRRNPLTWRVPFKDMLSPEAYRRIRWKFFRVHFQYLMASDRPCPYDYILLVGGPVAIADWAEKHHELTLSFITDGIRSGQGRRGLVAGAAQ